MIINGNSLEELRKLPENSIDSVVTDPPYGLSFMGKKWDYDVPSTELWTEVFRVLKPGGHLLAFAGTRTQHRMAVNIEDAGFEIRDMIAWVYGSGFPKSLNIGKAVDKLQGNVADELPTLPMQKKGEVGEISKNRRCAICLKAIASENPCRCDREYKANNEHKGWGTAFKPALEPITVARKPIKGTVANNVLEYGTGGINIDGCRVGTEQTVTNGRKSGGTYNIGLNNKDFTQINTGRFPANFIHDGSNEVVGLFPETKKAGNQKDSSITAGKSMFGIGDTGKRNPEIPGDSGSAARFFYTAKASKGERNKGLEGFEVRTVNDGRDAPIDNAFQRGETPRANIHPTVKPVKLMQYLVRLVTPKGGTVLDPFNGSGTTGIACKLEGFDYIGIELDLEYCKISEARIDAWEPDKQEKLI